VTALEAADTVVCVSGADPVALQRTVRALDELRDLLPDVRPVVVVNRLRRGPVPGDPRQEVAAALERFAGVEVAAFLPADPRATDAALAAGRALAEVAPSSSLRTALRALAADLAGDLVPAPATGSRRPPRSRADHARLSSRRRSVGRLLGGVRWPTA
jgi:Flp pilus assembly CpaE family ATPase